MVQAFWLRRRRSSCPRPTIRPSVRGPHRSPNRPIAYRRVVATRVPNLDDLGALRGISDVRVAPGGERIAYVVTTADPVVSTIWIDDQPAAEGRAPRWLADGRLAFVRDNDIRILPTVG